MNALPLARYIDPFTDFGFKKIFGNELNKDLLISFLNAVFEGRKQLSDISYRNTERPGRERGGRTVIFDILCVGDHEEQVLIEMQKIDQEFFKDRCVYYTSSLICDQFGRGDKAWGYQLKETHLIGIMDFCLPDSDPEYYIHHVQLSEITRGSVFYDRLGYVFIELPKFRKAAEELQAPVDQWIYALKHMHKMKKNPVFLKDRVFHKLFNIAEMSNLSIQERKNYDVSLKRKWDWENSLKYAKKRAVEEGLQDGMKQGIDQGMKQGLEQGLEQGIKQGLEQGIEKGVKQGQWEAQHTIARNLKLQEVALDIIIAATGLTAEEIEDL